MSEPENFLSRWSRLKRESGVEESGDGNRTVDALPDADISTPPAFDPASLPPIESIVADSDIRLFLQPGVPAELTCAALRSAWAADPAIRDFIGIAESQWDFNDPAAMPGFGPLGAADYAHHLAVRALASLNTPEGAQEYPGIVEQPASPSAYPPCSEPVAEVGQAGDAPADPPRQVDPAPEASLGPRCSHSHGGALPK
jgi:Protein of unknown function (DUF3306)